MKTFEEVSNRIQELEKIPDIEEELKWELNLLKDCLRRLGMNEVLIQRAHRDLKELMRGGGKNISERHWEKWEIRDFTYSWILN